MRSANRESHWAAVTVADNDWSFFDNGKSTEIGVPPRGLGFDPGRLSLGRGVYTTQRWCARDFDLPLVMLISRLKLCQMDDLSDLGPTHPCPAAIGQRKAQGAMASDFILVTAWSCSARSVREVDIECTTKSGLAATSVLCADSVRIEEY